jgi:hypothetical protein
VLDPSRRSRDVTYPPSPLDRDQMIASIRLVGKRELMREAGIAMRTIDGAHQGQDVADEDLKRMADAAQQIVSRKQKREDGEAAALTWLLAKRAEMGLTDLSKMLGVDAANLGKVIVGNRRVSRSLQSEVALLRRT